jgi:hypothetical protein
MSQLRDLLVRLRRLLREVAPVVAKVESPWYIGLAVVFESNYLHGRDPKGYAVSHMKCDIASVFAFSTTSLSIVDGVLKLCDGALAQHTSYRQAPIVYMQQCYAAG